MSEERGTRVYVGNLTDKIKKEHLEEEFTKYGKLNSVWVSSLNHFLMHLISSLFSLLGCIQPSGFRIH